MSSISENQKSEIIALVREGKLSREQIAAKVGVSPGTIGSIKAHLTMGTYTEPSEADEVIDATFIPIITTFNMILGELNKKMEGEAI